MACLLSFQPDNPNYKVVLLVNKDDYYIKPLVLPHVWKDTPEIMDSGVVAPKDLSDSNTTTWFGVTTGGRYAVLTMVRTRADATMLRTGRQVSSADEPKRRRVRMTGLQNQRSSTAGPAVDPATTDDEPPAPPAKKGVTFSQSEPQTNEDEKTDKEKDKEGEGKQEGADGKDSDSEAQSLSTMTSSEQKMSLNEVHKRKPPNHNLFFESNAFVPRSLTIVHREDAKVSKHAAALHQAMSVSFTEQEIEEREKERQAEEGQIPIAPAGSFQEEEKKEGEEQTRPSSAASTSFVGSDSEGAIADSPSMNMNASMTVPPLKGMKKAYKRRPAAIHEDLDSSRNRDFAEYKKTKMLNPVLPLEDRPTTEDLILVGGQHKKMNSKAKKKLQAIREEAMKKERDRRIEECPKHMWELVSKFLGDPRKLPPADYVQRVAQVSRTQNFVNHKFCLVVGDLTEAFFYSSSNRERVVYALTPGEYGLTSSPLLNPDWPKITHSRREFEKLLQGDVHPAEKVEQFFEILGNQKRYAPAELPTTGVGDELEILLSPMFVAHKQIPHYGTRCSTVAIIDSHDITIHHREFVPEKKNKKAKEKDAIPGVPRSSALWHALKNKSKGTPSAKKMARDAKKQLMSGQDEIMSESSSSSDEQNDSEPETEFGYDLLAGVASPDHPHRSVVLVTQMARPEASPQAPAYKKGATGKFGASGGLTESGDESTSPRRGVDSGSKKKDDKKKVAKKTKGKNKKKTETDTAMETSVSVSSVRDIIATNKERERRRSSASRIGAKGLMRRPSTAPPLH
eukprot:TRINITY_DN67150_c10_g2_i1.p1 TRINITY_DN67150_c10_g2~~TRINITY_DN67150_c10_g2_i1.p1  ORF type:complete len:793 (+),score=112.74 TRINITY_DN67150_c10_g2_i1:105-2483(+)